MVYQPYLISIKFAQDTSTKGGRYINLFITGIQRMKKNVYFVQVKNGDLQPL
jgi:hypothetical protein